MTETTRSCAPLGDGQCDGFAGSADDDFTPSGFCHCPCHDSANLPATIPLVRDWHDGFHGITRKERAQ